MTTATTTTTFAVATPHALILTVSHDLLFCQPPSLRRRECRPFIGSLHHFNEHPTPAAWTAETNPRSAHAAAGTAMLSALVMRARQFHSSARLTDETSRSESGDSRLPSDAAFVYPVIRLACVVTLWSHAPGIQTTRQPSSRSQTRNPTLIGSPEHSKCFFAGGQCSSLMTFRR
jgi:hypothetical protein